MQGLTWNPSGQLLALHFLSQNPHPPPQKLE